MKMTDYPCLYRFADAEISIQCDFFCGLSSVFRLCDSEIINHSRLFAHTSQGILFNGTGLTDADIDSFGKKRIERPFADCKTLSAAFSSYDLKNEACQICKLSHNFKNSFLKEERTLLSLILQKENCYADLLLDLQPKNFCSVCHLAPGKCLRSHPLIHFNRHLLSYLQTLPDIEESGEGNLENNFAPYLHDQVRKEQRQKKIVDATEPMPVTISFHDISDCVHRELSALYAINTKSLTDAYITMCRTKNRNASQYGYIPPTIKQGKSSDPETDVASILANADNRTKRKRPRHPHSSSLPADFQISLFDLPPSSVQTLAHSSNNTEEAPTDEIASHIDGPENRHSASQRTPEQNVTALENPSDHAADFEILNAAIFESASNSSAIIRYAAEHNAAHKKIHLIEMQPEDVSADICINCLHSINYSIKHTLNMEQENHNNVIEKLKAMPYGPCFMSKTCGLLYPKYSITDRFFSYVIDCGIEDMHNIHLFLSDSCSSATICIEAVRHYSRFGLLFYMPCSGRFYFFDMEFPYSNFLHPILGAASKTRFLSLNSIPVYDMLLKLGFARTSVESLANLFACTNKLNYNLPFSMLFKITLGISIADRMDFYRFAMPYYEAFNDTLIKQIGQLSDARSTLENFRSMDCFNRALASAYNLSDIVLDLEQGVIGINQLDFHLNFNKDMPIIAHGILYLVSFPALAEIDGEAYFKLFQRIIASVFGLPYTCILHARLLSVSLSAAAFFCTSDGDEFFDLLLACARQEYQNTFQSIPVIDTKRIIY